MLTLLNILLLNMTDDMSAAKVTIIAAITGLLGALIGSGGLGGMLKDWLGSKNHEQKAKILSAEKKDYVERIATLEKELTEVKLTLEILIAKLEMLKGIDGSFKYYELLVKRKKKFDDEQKGG